MNDQSTAPFSPFSPSPPPTPTSPPGGQVFEGEVSGKKPRKKRVVKTVKLAKKPRKSNVAIVQPHTVAPGYPAGDKITAVPTRKRARKPSPTMIPIGILPALAGLAEAETAMLISIIGNMQELPKKSRAKIVAALGKVFA